MPLIYTSPEAEDFRLLVWRVEETTETLKKFLPEKTSAELQIAFSHPERLRQKLVVSMLMETLGFDFDPQIFYLPGGKPVLKNSEGHISISHSRQHVGVLYHPFLSCGLDLEEPTDRLRRMAVRFVNTEEEAWIGHSRELHDLCLVWSAKEAVFKAIGGGGIVFREHLTVKAPHQTPEGTGHTEVLYNGSGKNKKFPISYRHLDGVLLVHTIA